MIILDINDFPLNSAFLFSGGVESSLLYYLLAKQAGTRNLNLFVIDRFNKPIDKANKIFSLINNKLNYTNGKLNILNIPKVENYLEVWTATFILEKKFDSVVWGINKYPDDETIRPNLLFDFVEKGKLKLPFATFTKNKIIETFYKLDIVDILEQTHSCGLNNFVPCKSCFNCKEREWAYKKLNIAVNYGI